MSKRYCAVCDAESDLCYKCHRCGKPFDGDSDSSGEQQLRGDGGSSDLEQLSTHDLVGKALVEHNDQDATDGVPKHEVVEWITSRTELGTADVHDAIEWLHNRGHIYEPCPDHIRRTEADDDRWLSVVWHEVLSETRISAGDLDPRYLTDRYSAETREEVKQLVLQTLKEVHRRDDGRLTLDDFDVAEDKLSEAGDYEIVTDGGLTQSSEGGR